MEQALGQHPEDSRLLRDYYQACVAAGALARARDVLNEMQQRAPRDQAVRRLRIALCLQQDDSRSAMGLIETLVAFSTPEPALIDSALQIRENLGPCAIDAKTGPNPSLSLCMIVKNEQAFLGPCLHAVKPLVDEMVVLDTGSNDRSADIARVFGARVYNFDWCDDFAAARNITLEKARGDWILILDADEIIAPRDHAALKQLLTRQQPPAHAHALVTRNYINRANSMQWQANDHGYAQYEVGMGWFPTRKVRLFPRTDRIRFEYPVHELVDRSVERAGMSISDCPVPIHHYGHLNEARNQRKALHYFDLGYRKLDQLGNDPTALRELAVQAGELDRWPQAIELWQRFLTLCPDSDEAHANLGGAFWQSGEYEKGIRSSQKAIARNPVLREAHYNLAVNRLMQDRLEEARKGLQAILENHPEYTAARFMLAAVLCLNGRDGQGRSMFSDLCRELSDQVLDLAIADLAGKFSREGFSRHAERLMGARS